ncbi:hypothetical protein J3458_018918 [Metarhizium acridum]|uniref:Uncharacterized protein n=1 Tax=Metarhizium acridum (strain CQMa 102) TaxID=655827 RepID=E9DWB0_METAQ|nr:uncharacterized protein MAC_01908 [Metarhizium acridum CQMa 102]EFY91960.1 hypothetical protein MAC_01908 [Metarhizium acridum CQMa 102]KAG8409836.1 hypothetical protein J3458_018918 [Metarhizium acridum]
MDAPTPKATPKRKRYGEVSLSPVKFSFDPSTAESTDDGSNSPRSKVAHRFRGLALGSGGGVVNEHGHEADVGDGPDSARKRQRPDDVVADVSEEDRQPGADSPTPRSSQALGTRPKATAGHLASQIPTLVEAAPEPVIQPPRRRRAGTPPLKLHKSPKKAKNDSVEASEAPVADEDDIIVDPVRAALTWHDDEITVYDPNDKDDDGTGINGVGFKPTPAIAEARAIRRRHQMAEYRKREESEARARRSQRRRGEEPLSARLKKKSPSRKVRFVDSEGQNAVVTTCRATM